MVYPSGCFHFIFISGALYGTISARAPFFTLWGIVVSDLIHYHRMTSLLPFDRYHDYLKTGGSEVQLTASPGQMFLEANDPLYGRVVVQQTGRFLAGAVRIKDRPAAKQLIEQVLVRMGKEQGPFHNDTNKPDAMHRE